MTPCDVCTAIAWAWGTEWVTGMNSTSNGPTVTVSPSPTGCMSVFLVRPASSIRFRARPRVSARPVDRQRIVAQVADAVAVAQQVLDGADVVLVAVGEHERLDALGVLPQVGEVGQDQIDPVHVRVGEHQPAVDEDDRAVGIVGGALLDRHAVAADLAETAEEDDSTERPRLGRVPT